MRTLPALFLTILILSACDRDKAPSPAAVPTPAQTALETAEQFLRLWQAKQYAAMYSLLATSVQQSITREKFVGRYEAIAEEATIQDIDFSIIPPSDPNSAEIAFMVTLHTAVFGDITEDHVMRLVEEERWRVVWTPNLIFRDLEGPNLIHRFVRVPRRGAILDRNGEPLAYDGEETIIGTSKRMAGDPKTFAATVAPKLGLTPADIEKALATNDPDFFFIPLKTFPPLTPQQQIDELAALPGVAVQKRTRRVYPLGAAAAHLTGYLAEVNAEQLKELTKQGYGIGDLVGVAGLEASFERELAGERGGLLTIISPEGQVQKIIKERPAKPGVDVQTTIDGRAQRLVDEALGPWVGAAVLMDPRDNSILALVSHPSYNPNDFVGGITADRYAALANDPNKPFLNRVVGATYPPGSTFKVITGAAGLEKGGYTPQSRFPCPPVWYGLGPDSPKRNWQAVDRGNLTIAEGLMTSCNPVFYEIGKALNRFDENLLPEFARAFGFGRPTGVLGLPEATGTVPDPQWKRQTVGEAWFTGDTVNMAIGQGFLTVTPLQLVNAYSALVTDGRFRKPRLIRRVGDREVPPEEMGRVPASAQTLAVLKEGMRLVTSHPGGTAYSVFASAPVPMAGKSGTAEDVGLQTHALFAAFAPYPDPQALTVVVLDQGEFGSTQAGPISRQILQRWLTGR